MGTRKLRQPWLSFSFQFIGSSLSGQRRNLDGVEDVAQAGVDERLLVRGQLAREISAGYAAGGDSKIEAQARAGRLNKRGVDILFDFGAKGRGGRSSMPPGHTVERHGGGFYLPVVAGKPLASVG